MRDKASQSTPSRAVLDLDSGGDGF